MRCLCVLMLSLLFLAAHSLGVESLSISGGPADTGYNVGSAATLRATVKGIAGDPTRYAVFAEIQYVGTTAVASVEMDRAASSPAGELDSEAHWPVPADAPTGLYSLAISVED